MKIMRPEKKFSPDCWKLFFVGISVSIFLFVGHSIASAAIVINELMANNDSTIMDPYGYFTDWVELHNTGSSSVSLYNYKITDDNNEWIFPSVSIPAGGYLLVWCNGNDDQATMSTDFKLSADGETVSILNQGDVLLDHVTYPPLDDDEAYGRNSNGSGSFEILAGATPGENNDGNPDAPLVTLNEMVSNNATGIQDQDGDYSDWIELYNTSSSVSVNLLGLKLQDTSNEWVFPDITMNPQSYLIVFASGKDRLMGELHTNFGLSSSGETLSLVNLNGVVINTVEIPPLYPDESYGRFPNGSGDYQVFVNATPGTENDDYVGPPPDPVSITINEVSSNNETIIADEDGDYEDWIELYNTGSTTINMDGLKLRDSGQVWTFTNYAFDPGAYLIVFASSKDRESGEFHTNFKLSADGEVLGLLNTNNTVIEQINIPPLDADTSLGHLPNGAGPYVVFEDPTPGESNYTCIWSAWTKCHKGKQYRYCSCSPEAGGCDGRSTRRCSNSPELTVEMYDVMR